MTTKNDPVRYLRDLEPDTLERLNQVEQIELFE